MIKTTNKVKEFIEDMDGPIFIYGAGVNGYWVGHYMKRCNIDFVGFIDRKRVHDECYYIGKRIYKIEELLNYKDKRVRIIIPIKNYESVLTDLLYFTQSLSIDIICLIPRYDNGRFGNGILGTEGWANGCDINLLLAYFRNKLFKGEVPTIISNDCFSAVMCAYLGLPLLTPTIGVGIEPEDFVKICEHPDIYLKSDIDESFWNFPVGVMCVECPAIRIKDVTINFAHDNDVDRAVKRWNMGKKMINWSRMIYVLSDLNYTISLNNMNRFIEATKGKESLILHFNGRYFGRNFSNEWMVDGNLYNHHIPVEIYFDLLGWINGECKNNR